MTPADERSHLRSHPDVTFRDGPTGRRAPLIDGPDVWEVIRAVRSATASEPELSPLEIVGLVSANTGVPTAMIDQAVRYWTDFPSEIDARIATADRFEDA